MSGLGQNIRWWENYFVRYFVGTVVGAAIVAFLNDASTSPIAGMLDFLHDTSEPAQGSATPLASAESQAPSGVGFLDVTVVAAIGLAFCYVASGPVLTVHATRPYLHRLRMRQHWTTWVVSAVATLVLVWGMFWLLTPHGALPIWSILVLSATVWIQVALVISGIRDNFSELVNFYWRLSGARSSPERQVAEYVESYRHLREHGNAFTILLSEVALGFVLYNTPTATGIVPVIAVWMLPASAVWLIGTMLEARLSSAPRA